MTEVPRLRELVFLRVSEDVTFAWSAYLTIKKVATVLRSCHNLVSCKVEIYPHSAGGDDDHVVENMLLPRLERLTVGEHVGNLAAFFDALDIPTLRHIGFYAVSTWLHPSVFGHSFNESGCKYKLSTVTSLISLKTISFIFCTLVPT